MLTRQHSPGHGAADFCCDTPRSDWPLCCLDEFFAVRCVQQEWPAGGVFLIECPVVAGQEPETNAQSGIGSATKAAHIPTSDSRKGLIKALYANRG